MIAKVQIIAFIDNLLFLSLTHCINDAMCHHRNVSAHLNRGDGMRSACDPDGDGTGTPDEASLVKDNLCICPSLPIFHKVGSQWPGGTSCGDIFDAPCIVPGSAFHVGKIKDVYKLGS